MSNQKKRLYGIGANLHLKPTDLETDLLGADLIRKHTKIKLNITVKSLLTFVITTVVLGIIVFSYLTANTIRTKYTFLPILLISLGIEMILGLVLFVDDSNVNSLMKAFIFLRQQINSFMVRIGRSKKFKGIGIERIRSDGYIEFSDGEIGKIYEVDGYTSRTLFPEEIDRLEEVGIRYNQGRDKYRTTTEVKISSSKLQNAEEQIKALDNKILRSNNKAIKDICYHQRYFLAKNIHNIRFTIVQYIILKDSSLNNLEKTAERFLNFVINRNYYYNAQQLSQKEAIEIFSQIFNFK